MSLFKVIWNLIIWKVFHVHYLLRKMQSSMPRRNWSCSKAFQISNAFWQLFVSTLDVNASPSTAALPPSQFTSNRVSSGSLGRALSNSASSQLSVWLKIWKHESLVAMLLMEEILHQLIGLSHYLQSFIHPRWCRISSIKSISKRDLFDRLAFSFALHRQLWFCHLFNSIVHTDCQGFMD